MTQRYGLDVLGTVVTCAGTIQLAAGLLRMGQWFRAVSPAIVHGLITGFAIVIAAEPIPRLPCSTATTTPKGSTLANLISIPAAIRDGILSLDGSPHDWASSIGMLTILVLLLWKPLAPWKLSAIPRRASRRGRGCGWPPDEDMPLARVTLPDSL